MVYDGYEEFNISQHRCFDWLNDLEHYSCHCLEVGMLSNSGCYKLLPAITNMEQREYMICDNLCSTLFHKTKWLIQK
jgi:hypothetical protein